ncbi:MAG TPA: hydantoinase/oxoprolinase family protein, partial [Acidimicrobiales bacterium]|nr:hydantoinase/oxoprolinase family protein [Acidimicrobiales bacterium]
MTVRVGVDVGGTFTKAVAVDLDAGVVAESVLPTTHDAAEGVAAGVVRCVADVAAKVGADQVELVTHSTTQAVNALLEGDVGTVGIVGMGRRPELAKARKRTELTKVELSAGKHLSTESVFLDVTDGLDGVAARKALTDLKARGVSAIATAEAFAPDDASNETMVAAMATDLGLPSCASTDLSGLYGLELRAVTAAVNASIMPIALRTASHVEEGVLAAGIDAPVMVMRGDGGATDLAGFKSAPARTLYSGPAASVAGALRYTGIRDGIVVEVGGTSTNVAGLKLGRPSLSYVTVASHATALRAVDVRVIGVAGGSMLRVRRGKVWGVGPRSAHIGGLGYACFTDPARLDGARAVTIAPRSGDPDDYLVLELTDGTHVAITLTCAANALSIPQRDDYCWADPATARAALDLAGEAVGLPGDEVSRRMLWAGGEAVCELVTAVATSSRIEQEVIVAVGGGAGGLGRHVAQMMGYECVVPDRAEVISSIGDALSLLRAERERTIHAFDPSIARQLATEVENEVVAAGAAPTSVEVHIEEQPDKGTV